MITLEILARIESLLAVKTGRGEKFRLCEFFDYFAGTSTGAIIATGLARGLSTRELLEFYRESGAAMFEKAALLNVQRLDSIEFLDELSRVGKAVAKEVSLDHFGAFV